MFAKENNMNKIWVEESNEEDEIPRTKLRGDPPEMLYESEIKFSKVLNEKHIQPVSEKQFIATLRNLFKKYFFNQEAYEDYGKKDFVEKIDGVEVPMHFEQWQELKTDVSIQKRRTYHDKEGNVVQIVLNIRDLSYKMGDYDRDENWNKFVKLIDEQIKKVGYSVLHAQKGRFIFEPNYYSTTKIPEKLYHFSVSQNRDSIMRRGLIPKDQTERFYSRYKGKIFLFTRYSLKDFQEMIFAQESHDIDIESVYAGKVQIPPIVVFEIDTSKVKKGTKFYEDASSVNGIWTYSWIPPQALKVVYEDKDEEGN